MEQKKVIRQEDQKMLREDSWEKDEQLQVLSDDQSWRSYMQQFLT